MTTPIRHKQSLSSVIADAAQAIQDDPEANRHRIFAATRVQELYDRGAGHLEMRQSWGILRSQTITDTTVLMLDTAPWYCAILIDRNGNHTAFMDFLTLDRNVFGGETIVYEPGHEPTNRDEKSLRAPQHAKVIQPVPFEVIEHDSKLFVNGPEEFFAPTGHIRESSLIHTYRGFPVWEVLKHEDDDGEWDETFSALLDLTEDPNLSTTKVTLVPTFWSINTVSLHFQADWQDFGLCGHIATDIGPFRIEHFMHNGKELRTEIVNTRLIPD